MMNGMTGVVASTMSKSKYNPTYVDTFCSGNFNFLSGYSGDYGSTPLSYMRKTLASKFVSIIAGCGSIVLWPLVGRSRCLKHSTDMLCLSPAVRIAVAANAMDTVSAASVGCLSIAHCYFADVRAPSLKNVPTLPIEGIGKKGVY